MLNKKKTPFVILAILVVGTVTTIINYRIYLSKIAYTQNLTSKNMYKNNTENAYDSFNNKHNNNSYDEVMIDENTKKIIEDTEIIIKQDKAELNIIENQNDDDTLEIAISFSTEKYEEYLDNVVEEYNMMWLQIDRTDMTETKKLAESEYTIWDEELNTLYNYLRELMNEDDFSRLKEEELAWIKSKEEYAKKMATGYTGNSYNLAYTNALIDMTRDRTYYLLDLISIECEKN